jgi:ElaB/YqjD/DUF883 family membrane-anchored ribosome-binding protein
MERVQKSLQYVYTNRSPTCIDWRKDVMAEKAKMTVDELQKRLGDLTEVVETSRVEVEAMIKRRPLESAGVVFIAGVVIGLMIGASLSRR